MADIIAIVAVIAYVSLIGWVLGVFGSRTENEYETDYEPLDEDVYYYFYNDSCHSTWTELTYEEEEPQIDYVKRWWGND